MNTLHLTLRQLQIFVAVARTGSTMAAGSDIALSQSATSAALNELERVLSLRLFDRAGKRLLLNDNGRALLPRALSLLDGAADVERMAHASDEQAQALRIGASTTIGNYLLPPLLADFLGGRQDTAEGWHSKVVIGNTTEIAAAVAAFELDVGLIEGPCHEPALAVTPWLSDELVVVAAPSREIARAAGTQRIALRALRDETWLLREAGSGTRESTDQALLPHLHAYRRSIELGSSEAIKHAVAAGLGIACLSSWVVDDLVAAGRLTRLRTVLPGLHRRCNLVVPGRKQPTAAMCAFIAHAATFRGADEPAGTAKRRGKA